MRSVMILAPALLLLGLPGPAAAHDEAKTPISGSIILDMTRPSAPVHDRAFDQSLREPGPPPPKSPLEGQIQPDGSVRYGNTTVIIRHQDCPPGSEFFEPRPRPGRRR